MDKQVYKLIYVYIVKHVHVLDMTSGCWPHGSPGQAHPIPGHVHQVHQGASLQLLVNMAADCI